MKAFFEKNNEYLKFTNYRSLKLSKIFNGKIYWYLLEEEPNRKKTEGKKNIAKIKQKYLDN